MGAEDIRDALRGLNAALEGQAAEGVQTLSVQTFAAGAVKCLGEGGLRELLALFCSPAETDGADTVLVLDGGKIRAVPFANLAEMIATGVIFTIVSTPSDAKVTINGKVCERAFVEYDTEVEWEVSKDGYVTKSGSQVVTENTTIEVALAEGARFTIVPTPSDADVYINGEKTDSVYVEKGSTVEWEVSESGYTTKTGSQVVDGDTTIEVEIVGEPFTFVYDSNSMYIYQGTANSSARTYTLFSIDGAYDIEINGVLVENVTASRTFGSDYLNDTGNVVKIYPYEGTVINSAYSDPTSSSNYYNYMQNRYISEIQSWGQATFGRCNYLLGAYANSSYAAKVTSVPKLSNGFSAVTNLQGFLRYCTLLKMEIPEDFFARAGGVTTFASCFNNCTGLTGAIPTGLFDNCPSVTTFASCFQGCTGLTGAIPTGLFDNCPSVTTFASCFQGCTGLTGAIPTGLFDNCPSVTTFYQCFYGCSGLTEIPENLFINCTKVTNFSYCFDSGSSSVNNLEGESAFDRVDINGVETVIHLYERSNYPDLYTAPTTTTYCYCYQTKLDDYDAIPSGWK